MLEMENVWVPLANVVSATWHAVSDAFTPTPAGPDVPRGELEQAASVSTAISPAPVAAGNRGPTSDTAPTLEQARPEKTAQADPRVTVVV
jgi:hypothetical protein